jgi:hypothetical protein
MILTNIIDIANTEDKDEQLKHINLLKKIGVGDLQAAKVTCQNRFEDGYEWVELYNLLYE